MFKILLRLKYFLAKKWARIPTAIIGAISAIALAYWKVFVHPDTNVPAWLLTTAGIAAVLAALMAVPVAVLQWKSMQLRRQRRILQKCKK